MADQDPTEGEFHIVEHPIAGPARQFQVTLDDGTTLGVHSDPVDRIVQLDVVPPDRDAATATVELTETEAAAFASLLAGMRFVTSSYRGPHAGGAVQVRTATVPAGSPVVGRLVGEVAATWPCWPWCGRALPSSSSRPSVRASPATGSSSCHAPARSSRSSATCSADR